MVQIWLDNKAGIVWDISELVTAVEWKTSRIGAAGSLKVTYISGAPYQDKQFSCNNGDIVAVKQDGANVFYGYVFQVDSGKEEEVSFVAYDQIRYLLTDETYVFSNSTASDIVRKIAEDAGLKLGTVEPTRHRIPSLLEDSKKLLDIISKALDMTLIATKRIYVLYDDYGALTLRDAESMAVDVSIGDKSLLTDYSFGRSIDGETYNRIKLVQDNKTTGKRDVYIAQDSANMARWGRLQFYEKVDENLNSAQIEELLNLHIALKNREQQTLQVKALGDLSIRAGCYVPVHISGLGVGQYYLVQECTHRFEGREHTMSLELKVV